ncbi:MAG: acetyl-CoA carboxylase biotin carboxylase subunit [Geminicoccaceae bacterium]
MLFDKILIANRGEIACRVMRTCKKLGIKTVAVFSEADRDAVHVRMADEAVLLGPPPAAQSYLVIDKIMEAIRQTGAQAVHPGYGFLSENYRFAEALAAENVTFIGPPANAIIAMGDKIESKKLAIEAGVNTVPGYTEAISDPELAVKVANEIGYPVMVKASAGGGGKGMRIAFNDDEVREGLARSRSEAASSFGDDRCFVEKFIVEPRHIEMQVLADKHGNTLWLNERECSIQRRHQKVVEEAPSPALTPEKRREMGEQACALAQAVGYHSAGTVEFIYGAEGEFYFLEMNTRLQVEHPVTELITGIDLVEQMIRVAAGEKLPFSQSDIGINGWAMETRVYAEDPTRGFLPSTGRLVHYQEPQGEHIRVDTGVVEGSEVSMFYDPMIAKLCTWGPDRASAIDGMAKALDAYAVRGLGHNISFLTSVMHHPRFREGRLTTGFIAEEYGERFDPTMVGEAQLRRYAMIAVALAAREQSRASCIDHQLEGYAYALPTDWVVEFDRDTRLHVFAAPDEDGYDMTIDGHSAYVALEWRPGHLLCEARFDDKLAIFQVDPVSEGYLLRHAGTEVTAIVRSARAAELAARIPYKEPPDFSKLVMAPMPGVILRINVAVGQEVKIGQEVAILEAMKMENVLRAERDGVVEVVNVKAGDTVSADAVLIAFT